ncbi:MAG: MlaD family protein [Bacteroidaceae bacterium]|nr:MlaD family protein [Bacteroidaceae bacterium]
MKFFTKEVKIGLTGIAALVVLYLGISYLKGIKFSPSHNYYITFNNAKGLAASSPVYADGYQIGIVRNITYDFNKPGEVVVEVTVDDDVRMPVGTKASLAEGMLGGCTLNLTLGTNPKEVIAVGDTIKGSDDDGLMAQAAKMLPEVTVVLHHVDSLITTINTVASDPNIAKVIGNTEQLTANLNSSSQHLNKLLANDMPKLMKTFDEAGQNVNRLTGNLAELDMQQTLNKVNQTIDDVQGLIKLMEDPNGNLGLLLKDTAIYHNLNNTIKSANNLLIDLQAHPKRYVHFSVFGKKDK